MADEKSYPMTQEGKEKLEAELKDLKVNQRPKIVERIKVARSYGDLSENSEYEAAKNEQSMLESRIATVEHMIQYAQVVEKDATAADEVTVGKEITFQELPDEDPETFKIVGEAEADPMNGKISNDSPIAKGLLGHKVGEKVDLEIPAGVMHVKITSVK